MGLLANLPDETRTVARTLLKQRIGDETIFTRNDDDDFAQDDTLGGRISFARDATKLTMAQAARRLGVQTASWNAWECDRAVPRFDRLTMMAGILGVSPSWLLSGIGSGPLERKGAMMMPPCCGNCNACLPMPGSRRSVCRRSLHRWNVEDSRKRPTDPLRVGSP